MFSLDVDFGPWLDPIQILVQKLQTGKALPMEGDGKLELVVVYPAARDDLKEGAVSRQETLGQLKARVLGCSLRLN